MTRDLWFPLHFSHRFFSNLDIFFFSRMSLAPWRARRKKKPNSLIQCLDYVCVDNASGCQSILKGGDKMQRLLLRWDKRAVQRQNISFTAKKHSQFSLSLVLISLSGYCIFCSPHAIAVALRTSEIMLGPNPGNHFGVISLGTAHPTHIFFFQEGIKWLTLPDYLAVSGWPAPRFS